MSLESTLARVAELQSALAPRPPAAPPAPRGDASFAQALRAAGAPAASVASLASPGAAPVTGGLPGAPIAGMPGLAPTGGGSGARALAAARGEIGQAEAPMGSNDSPRIAEYRRAVPGGPVGPWCAYFVSWCARQGGAPLGERGQGFASVDALYAWAQRAGRAVPASTGVPRPGDLIVWDEHVGIVENVLPDGRIQTIEGNSSDRVTRRTHPPRSALGYVRMG
jgi:hypothetical protein